MTGRRPLGTDELGSGSPDELDAARTAGTWLEASIDDAPVRPRSDFGDRVMAALADEPAPSSTGFLAPVRRLGFAGGFAASVRQAWASAFGGGRPVLARASALAYVLAVVIVGTSLAGVATVGVAGALGMLGPSPTQSTQPRQEPTSQPSETNVPTPVTAPPTAGESEEPSESPDASDDNGGSGEPDASDDHGSDGSTGSGSDDSSGPGSTGSGSDDSSGSGSGSDSGSSSETSTPRPTDTPRPTGTPKPTQTPN